MALRAAACTPPTERTTVMAGTSQPPPLVAPGPATQADGAGSGHGGVSRNRRGKRLTGGDRLRVVLVGAGALLMGTGVVLMVAVPLLMVTVFVWLPAIATVALSFTSWNGIGDFSRIKWIGFKNYHDVVTIYPAFWPAVRHNIIWLFVLFLVATPAGISLAVLIDKGLRGSRLYQSAIYMPVVLSLALIAFIWQLQFSADFGVLNTVLQGLHLTDHPIDFFGDPTYNLWAALAATCWRHIGYIMLLYLAGLKGVDPSLREAAQVDGASEVQTFF